MDHLGMSNKLLVRPSLVDDDPFIVTWKARFAPGSAGTLRVLCQRWQWAEPSPLLLPPQTPSYPRTCLELGKAYS